MGLLFQPRRTSAEPLAGDTSVRAGRPTDRRAVFRLALEAVVIGDTSRFADLFTEDVVFTTPHASLHSRDAVQRSFGAPEDALSDVVLVECSAEESGDTIFVEWRLDATFSGPLLFADEILVEPTGAPVRLRGASVADFRGERIAVFRHYFDDSEVLDGVAGVPAHVRWLPTATEEPSS